MTAPDETPDVVTLDANRHADLDAARQARAAKRGEAASFTLGGIRFELPPELPVRFVELISQDRARAAFEELLGPDANRQLWADVKPSMEDLEAISHVIGRAYGFEGGLGNLSASGASSSTTSAT